MKPIANWKRGWRMISVQCMTLAAALQGAWQAVPDDWKATLSPGLVHWLTLGLLMLGIAGRLVQQDKVSQS